MKHRVFIYGTLKTGQYFNRQYLGDGKGLLLGPALASTDYSLYIDGLPHLIAEKTDVPVKGELWEIDELVLKSLDDLEGHPMVYKRELIDTYLDGNRVLAWAYLRSPSFKGKSGAYKDTSFE
jgi:gamma-glutamylaminecyclotransferase